MWTHSSWSIKEFCLIINYTWYQETCNIIPFFSLVKIFVLSNILHGTNAKCFCGRRYDHYAVLCELMPTGLPCLALCLKMWLKGKYDEDVYQEVSSSLGFRKETPLLLYTMNRWIYQLLKYYNFRCSSIVLIFGNYIFFYRPIPIPREVNFPSGQIYIGIEWFANVRSRFEFVACGDQ